jgi:hypothetical protein
LSSSLYPFLSLFVLLIFKFLKLELHPNLLDAKDQDGRNLLHFASEGFSPSLIALLSSSTPLFLFLFLGTQSWTIIPCLYELGIGMNEREHTEGDTPLHISVKKNNIVAQKVYFFFAPLLHIIPLSSLSSFSSSAKGNQITDPLSFSLSGICLRFRYRFCCIWGLI